MGFLYFRQPFFKKFIIFCFLFHFLRQHFLEHFYFFQFQIYFELIFQILEYNFQIKFLIFEDYFVYSDNNSIV